MSLDWWERNADKEEPVGNRPKRSINSPIHPSLTRFCAVFTSLVAVAVADKAYVSRQSPNSRRRKGTVEDPCRVQAGDRRKVWPAILHHKSRWGCCSTISLRGVGTDRAEVGGALHLQSHEEKVLEQGELLGAGRRDGWARASADSATFARRGQNQGRSRRQRISDLSESSQHGNISAESSGRKVYA